MSWLLNDESVSSGDRSAVAGRFQVPGAMHSEATLASKRPGPGHHAVKPSAGTDRPVGRESVSSGDRSAVAGRFQVPGARHWLRAQERVPFKTAVLMYTRPLMELRRHT